MPLGAQAALGPRLPAVAAAAVRCDFDGGKDASEADGASQAAAIPTKEGVTAAFLHNSGCAFSRISTPTPGLVFATMLSDQRVGLASARRGDWIAIREEPSSRDDAGLRKSAGWQQRYGQQKHEQKHHFWCSAFGGPPTKDVVPAPRVAAEAQAEAAMAGQAQQLPHCSSCAAF